MKINPNYSVKQNVGKHKNYFLLMPIILAFGFTLASLGYGPMSAWAQEPQQNYFQTRQNVTHATSGMHPCFSQYQNMTGRTQQFGQYKNQTGITHHFGQYGNMTGGRMLHPGQFGNQTNFKLNPCLNQNTNKTSFGKTTIQQGGVASVATTSVLSHPIPSWVKNNAKWWSQNQMGDSDFVSGIQYLIQQGIMKIPQSQTASSQTSQIPSWIKSNGSWWASGQISDDEFVKGIQWLVSNGIVKV